MPKTKPPDAIDRETEDLTARETVWMGAPYAGGDPDPARVELFASRERAERYVESAREPGAEREWVSRDEKAGRQLVEGTDGTVGVVSPLRTAAPGETSPSDGSALERVIPSDSSLRSYLPGVSDPPEVDRELVPFAYFDAVLFTERGHLQLRAGSAPGDEPERYLRELTDYARKTVETGTAAADDRVASKRIRDLDGYFRTDGATGYYGKPRYRLAKKLSDWGGETGRCATLELWVLFQLVLRLYPDHLAWEAGYGYHEGDERDDTQ